MNPLNLAITSSPPPPPPPAANDLLVKRKRGRPRKDETLTQQENSHVTPKPDANLVGKMVYGVVEGSFDAGYLLNVKVKDTDTKLRGVVFIPGKVAPITPENDVAPNVKMIGREEIFKNQSDDPNDQPMKDAVDNDLEIPEYAARALALMSQQSNGEAMIEKEEAETRLVEFFPTPMMTAQPNLVSVEQQKSPGETRGFDLMAEEPVCPGQKVPQELQLELGNKTTMSGDNNGNAMETDPKSSVVSKSGFIANLFEGEDKKVDCDEEAATSVK